MSGNGIELQKHPFDSQLAVTSERQGIEFARIIDVWTKQEGIELPPDSTLLGLGAGMGFPELALASELGIPDNSITLIDKQDLRSHPRFSINRPDVTYMGETGIFNFLENPNQKGFTVVTGFGLEYVLDNPQTMDTFIKALPNILLPHSFVVIYPYDGKPMDNIWEDNNFQLVYKLSGHYVPLVYTYTGIQE